MRSGRHFAVVAASTLSIGWRANIKSSKEMFVASGGDDAIENRNETVKINNLSISWKSVMLLQRLLVSPYKYMDNRRIVFARYFFVFLFRIVSIAMDNAGLFIWRKVLLSCVAWGGTKLIWPARCCHRIREVWQWIVSQIVVELPQFSKAWHLNYRKVRRRHWPPGVFSGVAI